MPACANCTQDFPEAPLRGKARIFCSPPCRVAAANSRRATTRKGRLGQTNPPLPNPPPPAARPTVDTSPSAAPSPRPTSLEALLDKAHSRVGVTAWEIATIAKMRGISAWAPVSKIIAR